MAYAHEKRRHPRFQIDAFATLESRGMLTRNDQAFGPVLDISRSGIRVRTGQPPDVGQYIILRVAVGDEIHTLRATAVRVAEAGPDIYDVGMDFSWCTADEIAFLERCIALVSQAD